MTHINYVVPKLESVTGHGKRDQFNKLFRPRATKCTVYLLLNVKHRGAIAVSVQSSQ